MHKVLIFENDQNQGNLLFSSIHNQYPSWDIISVKKLTDARRLINDSVYTGLFSFFLIDIVYDETKNLANGETDGFILARQIRNISSYYLTPILFTNNESQKIQYALSNFHCYSYFVKPYKIHDILYEIKQMLVTNQLTTKFEITDINRISYMLNIDDILYIEASGHIMLIHCAKITIQTRMHNMDSFTALLSPFFARIHKKYLINKSRITSIDYLNNYITINNTSLPLGRNYKNLLTRQLV